VIAAVADVAAVRLIGPAIGRTLGSRSALLLRDSLASTRALLAAARDLRPIVGCLLISDRPDVAVLADADGVHLPERGLDPRAVRQILGPDRLVGVSRHDEAGVVAAFAAGADYATLSPIWESPGKGPPLGTAILTDVARAGVGPVLALGGVDSKRARLAVRAGAAGVAVARAVTGAPDPAAALEAIARATREGIREASRRGNVEPDR